MLASEFEGDGVERRVNKHWFGLWEKTFFGIFVWVEERGERVRRREL